MELRPVYAVSDIHYMATLDNGWYIQLIPKDDDIGRWPVNVRNQKGRLLVAANTDVPKERAAMAGMTRDEYASKIMLPNAVETLTALSEKARKYGSELAEEYAEKPLDWFVIRDNNGFVSMRAAVADPVEPGGLARILIYRGAYKTRRKLFRYEAWLDDYDGLNVAHSHFNVKSEDGSEPDDETVQKAVFNAFAKTLKNTETLKSILAGNQ